VGSEGVVGGGCYEQVRNIYNEMGNKRDYI